MSRLTKVVSIHNNEPEFYEANIDLYPEMMGYEHQQAEMDCINKLDELEDLEEELGCPFEVVIKALKDGIVLENGKLYHCSLSFHKQQKYSNEDYILICYENGESVVGVGVKQYKKTWWLKGEKNE